MSKNRTRRNAFEARPSHFHGPQTSGTQQYPGFHTGDNPDVTAPYAQLKIDKAIDRDALTIDDYPVIVAIDMSGVQAVPDFDAIETALDPLSWAAQEALEAHKEDDWAWYDSLESTDYDYGEMPPDQVVTALFQDFGRCVVEPHHCLQSLLEGMDETEALKALEGFASKKPDLNMLMQVIGQFRYTEDVDDSRIVSVQLMTPFWPTVFDDYSDPEQAVAIKKAEEAGFHTVSWEDLGSINPDYTIVWEREEPKDARIEYHGTSWKNLIEAVPWMKDVGVNLPSPYKAQKRNSREETPSRRASRDTRRAMRRVALLDDISFFVDFLKTRHSAVSETEAIFSKDWWGQWHYQEDEPPAPSTAEKQFERWKSVVQDSGVDVSYVGETEHGLYSYVMNLDDLERLTKEARERTQELHKAYEELTGRKIKTVAERKRTATVAEVAMFLGVPKPTVYNWIHTHGLPYTKLRDRRGSTILLSIAEVEEWAALREAEGRRVATSADVRERTPEGVAKPRLREIRDYLGLSNERMAELVGIPTSRFKTYVAERWERKARSIPNSIMEAAEKLLDTQVIRTSKLAAAQRIEKEDVERALQETRWRLGAAAKLLGVSTGVFEKTAADVGVDLLKIRIPIAVARPRLVEIKDKLKFAYARFAEILGVSVAGLKAYIGTGGPWRKAESVPAHVMMKAEKALEELKPARFIESRLQRITAKQIQEAWDAGGQLTRAAKLLGVTTGVFQELAEHRGLDLPLGRLVDRITKQQLEALLEKHDWVKARVARELGVSGPYVTILMKKTGLQ